MLLDLPGHGEEFVRIGAGELDVDGVAAAHDFGAEVHFLGAGDGAVVSGLDAFAPVGGHGDGADLEGALLGAVGFHGHLSTMAAAAAGAATGAAGHAGVGDDDADDRAAVRADVFAAHLLGEFVNFGDVAVGDFEGGAVEHDEAAFDALTGDAGKEGGGDAVAGVNGEEDAEASEDGSEHAVAVSQAETQGRAINDLHKTGELSL